MDKLDQNSLTKEQAIATLEAGHSIEVYTKSDRVFIVLPISNDQGRDDNTKQYLCSQWREADLNVYPYRYIDNFFLFENLTTILERLNKALSILIYNYYDERNKNFIPSIGTIHAQRTAEKTAQD